MRTPKRPHANAVEQPGGARSASNGAQRYDQRSQCQRCLLTIVGGVREAWSIWRRGRLGTVCARGDHAAWSCGPSTSPLERKPCFLRLRFTLPCLILSLKTVASFGRVIRAAAG